MLIKEEHKNYLKKLAGILQENNNNAKNVLIIRKGHKLYHGTVEDFDKNNITVSPYDKVFWTSEYPEISLTYIPVASVTVYIKSKALANPSTEKNIQSLQKQIGIVYSDISGKVNVESYREAPIFEKMSNQYQQNFNQYIKLKKEVEQIQNYINKNYLMLPKDKLKEFAKKENNIITKLEKLDKELVNINLGKLKNEYVNRKLKQLGYKPNGCESYDSNCYWELKIKFLNNGEERILPANFRESGRLLTIVPKRDLKIYDLTNGGKLEGDLMEPDYHKTDLFRLAEKNGFDGVKINDFAQIEGVGNYGHTSIGLFKNTLKDVEIQEEHGYHPKDFWKNYVVFPMEKKLKAKKS